MTKFTAVAHRRAVAGRALAVRRGAAGSGEGADRSAWAVPRRIGAKGRGMPS